MPRKTAIAHLGFSANAVGFILRRMTKHKVDIGDSLKVLSQAIENIMGLAREMNMDDKQASAFDNWVNAMNSIYTALEAIQESHE